MDTKNPYPSEESIAATMEARKLSRIAAVQYLRRQSAKSASAVQPKAAEPKAPKAPKVAKPKAPKEAGECHLSEAKKEAVSVAVRKLIGKGVSVEGIVRSSLNPKYGMYIWYGLSDLRVVSVQPDKSPVVVAFKDESSWACREWKKLWAKRLRREEKTKAKLDKEAK